MDQDEQPLEEITEDEYQRRLLQSYKLVFESESGKAVLKDLKNAFKYYGTSLNDNPNIVMANEGKRFVVLYILSKLEEANGWRRID